MTSSNITPGLEIPYTRDIVALLPKGAHQAEVQDGPIHDPDSNVEQLQGNRHLEVVQLLADTVEVREVMTSEGSTTHSPTVTIPLHLVHDALSHALTSQ